MNISLFRKRVLITLTTCLLALTGLSACTSASTNTGSASATTVAATSTPCKHSYGYMGFDVVPDNDDLALMASKHYFAEYTQYAIDSDGNEIEVAEIKDAYDLNDHLMLTYSTEGALTGAYANLGGMVTLADYAEGVGYEADYSADYEADRESIKDVIDANEAPTDGLVYSETIEEAVPFTGDDTVYTCYVFTLSSVRVDDEGSETAFTNTYKLYTDGSKLHAQYIEYETGYATVMVFKTITGDIPEGFMTSPDTSGLEMADYESGSKTEAETE